jgi:hypothetical protein
MAAVFYEISFPHRVCRGSEIEIRHKTSIFTAGGGRERRNKAWGAGPLRWADVARGIRNTSDLELVRNFNLLVGGRHGGFRFKDFSDFAAEGQLIDTSAGGSSFQLRKGYVVDAVTRWRKITKPVKGTTRLTLNGEPCVVLEDGQSIGEWMPVFGETEFGFNPDTAPRFTLDTTTGVLVAVLPGVLSGADLLLAGYEFDLPARFASDSFKVRAHSRGKNWEYSNIMVKELRQ